jgi:hypothetical protein
MAEIAQKGLELKKIGWMAAGKRLWPGLPRFLASLQSSHGFF